MRSRRQKYVYGAVFITYHLQRAFFVCLSFPHVECSLGYFKDKLGNAKCSKCPVNSVTETDRKHCKCKSGYFRAPGEKISDNCTGRTRLIDILD